MWEKRDEPKPKSAHVGEEVQTKTNDCTCGRKFPPFNKICFCFERTINRNFIVRWDGKPISIEKPEILQPIKRSLINILMIDYFSNAMQTVAYLKFSFSEKATISLTIFHLIWRLSNQVEDSFNFFWPFQNVQTLPKKSKCTLVAKLFFLKWHSSTILSITFP